MHTDLFHFTLVLALLLLISFQTRITAAFPLHPSKETLCNYFSFLLPTPTHNPSFSLKAPSSSWGHFRKLLTDIPVGFTLRNQRSPCRTPQRASVLQLRSPSRYYILRHYSLLTLNQDKILPEIFSSTLQLFRASPYVNKRYLTFHFTLSG